MTAGPDGVTLDSVPAQTAAEKVARAAQMLREAWETHWPAIEAAQAQSLNVAGDDAEAFRQKFVPQFDQIKSKFPEVADACDRLAATCNGAVEPFLQQDQNTAAQLRA